LVTFRADSTNSTFTDAFAANAPGLVTFYAYSTNSTFTGALATNGINLKDVRINDISLSAANVDSVLIGFQSSTILTFLHLGGNNAPRTVASDAAFTTLNALIGANLQVN
jgi:hypothetical protein